MFHKCLANPFTLDWCWMRFKDNYLSCKLAFLTKIPSHWKVFVHFWTLNHLEFKASVGQTRIMESHFYFFTSWGWKIKLEMTKLRRASFENIYQLKLDIRHLLWYRNSEKVFVFAVFPGVSEFKDLQMFPWISIQIHLTIPWYESTAAFG